MAKKRKITPKKKKKSNKPVQVVLVLAALSLAALFVYFQFSRVETQPSVVIEDDAPIAIDIPDGYESFGVDVSHHQGRIPWQEILRNKALDSTIEFVYCKVTEGVGHVDREWRHNHAALEQLNKPHGGYHFFSIKSDPLLQAEHFLSECEINDKSLPPVLDVETEGLSDAQLIRRMKIWLNKVESICGIRPIIYTSAHFFTTKFSHHFPKHQFWIASYSREPKCINDSRIVHWQYSESGDVPGFDSRLDLNVSKLNFDY